MCKTWRLLFTAMRDKILILFQENKKIKTLANTSSGSRWMAPGVNIFEDQREKLKGAYERVKLKIMFKIERIILRESILAKDFERIRR